MIVLTVNLNVLLVMRFSLKINAIHVFSGLFSISISVFPYVLPIGMISTEFVNPVTILFALVPQMILDYVRIALITLLMLIQLLNKIVYCRVHQDPMKTKLLEIAYHVMFHVQNAMMVVFVIVLRATLQLF